MRAISRCVAPLSRVGRGRVSSFPGAARKYTTSVPLRAQDIQTTENQDAESKFSIKGQSVDGRAAYLDFQVSAVGGVATFD